MSGVRVNGTALALATAIAMAVVCVATALLAHGGQLFAAALAAGLGIAACSAYAGLALHAAGGRLAKLSEELTQQSLRLVRLEARGESAPLAQDVDALTKATGAIADSLEGQDARLRALEARAAQARDAAAALRTDDESARAEARPTAEPRSGERRDPTSRQSLPAEEAGRAGAGLPPSDRLTTRADFARAASAILGRLAPEALQVVQAPSDDAVLDDLEAGRLELWLQPVVTLPQRRLRLYAAHPNLRDQNGQPLKPDVIRPILERRRRLERLDAFALSQALLVAAHFVSRDRETAIALRVSRDSLASSAFLDGASRRLAEDRAAASRLVLAFDHGEIEAASAQEAAALARLRELGTGLALCALPSLDQDWASLARRGFGLALVPVETILAPRPHATTAFLVAEAARAGIGLVATGIGREREVPDLLDFEVPFAVGDAIAPARPVRAEVLAPDTHRAQPAEAEQQQGPTPFREFLRRAG